MGTSIIHVRRVNNWSFRLQKLGLFIDGEYTENVGAGKTVTFEILGDVKHLVQMGYKGKAYTNDKYEIYFYSGKEYYFEFGLFVDSNGFALGFHGTEGWDESGAAPIVKGVRGIKKLFD